MYGRKGCKEQWGILQSIRPSARYPMQSQHFARIAACRVRRSPFRCFTRFVFPAELMPLFCTIASRSFSSVFIPASGTVPFRRKRLCVQARRVQTCIESRVGRLSQVRASPIYAGYPAPRSSVATLALSCIKLPIRNPRPSLLRGFSYRPRMRIVPAKNTFSGGRLRQEIYQAGTFSYGYRNNEPVNRLLGVLLQECERPPDNVVPVGAYGGEASAGYGEMFIEALRVC